MNTAKYDNALKLRSIIVKHGTGGEMSDIEYRLLRAEFFDDPRLRQYLPEFVRENVDGSGIWIYLKDFHTGSGAYAARRKHVQEQFKPLIKALTEQPHPSDADITNAISRYDADGVSAAWQKAIDRRATDPEGAITAARTLMEEVCKHILEDANVTAQSKWDLPKLYSEAAKVMSLAPSQHSEDAFKRILGGSSSVVEGLGTLRNRVSDAHGGGRKRVRPSARHASFAVNIAGTTAMFLIETFKEKRSREQASRLTKKQTPVEYKGVHLSSRYDLALEIDAMKLMVDQLTPEMARRIDCIWCDSKACACYSVTVRDGLWVDQLLEAIKQAGRISGGYNGVYFDGQVPNHAFLDPWWGEDELDV